MSAPKNRSSPTSSDESMFGKFTNSVKNKVQNWKLNIAWKHLPDALQEKIGSSENLTTMFPFTCTLPIDDSNDDANNGDEVQLKISIEGELDNITFIFDPLDSNNCVIKGGNMRISFKNRQWFCTVMFDERGRDYVDMIEPLLVGKKSSADIGVRTVEAVENIIKLLDFVESED